MNITTAKHSTQQLLCDKKGYITLLAVLVLGAVAIIIAISLLSLGTSSTKTILAIEQSNQAKALANACTEEALQQIKDSVSFSGSNNLILGQGNCEYTVIKLTGQNREINSIGMIGTIIRKNKIIIDSITPNINIVSWREVEEL